jgi:TonB-dependent receptor
MAFDSFSPTVKLGAYGEYRERDYHTRLFIYNWNAAANDLPDGFRYMNIPNELLQENYYGERGLYLIEKVKWSDNYAGNNTLASGYASVNMPFGRLNIYAGLRFEHSQMTLTSNTKDYESSPRSTYYTYDDLFPSINMTYKPDAKKQYRLSYGRATNRPEFREVSPSVFYDFDLASNVQGNYSLRPAYIDNVDLAFELYPAIGEMVALSVFYKRFDNPIEWTYTVNGGTDLTYSYVNAHAANNYGVELDVRKNLDFIGLNNFSLNFNGALIKSLVSFAAGSKEKDRPMQGQSPYLINAGLFYRHPTKGWNAALLYNRIGKRIIGVGRSMGSEGDKAKIPDSYEMPRNAIDLSIAKKFGDRLELKLSARDLLAEKVSFKQFETTAKGEVEQITRQYQPGRNLNISLYYQF